METFLKSWFLQVGVVPERHERGARAHATGHAQAGHPLQARCSTGTISLGQGPLDSDWALAGCNDR
jgi:hypothetical protein